MQIPSDDQIGKNLATLRGQVTQQELGEKMRQRGFKWSQATVWDVERGKRPLRLIEALEVVAVLNKPGVTVESLWAVPTELHATQELKNAYLDANDKWQEVVLAISQLHSSKESWSRIVEKTKAAGFTPAPPQVTTIRRGAKSTQTKAEANPVSLWLSKDSAVQALTVDSAAKESLRQLVANQYDEAEADAAGDWNASMHGEEMRGK
ncbi:hypothetical protein [Glutamicibacter protophormiae]|uniref:hypothetical protein n=1 Tax=Glutamicibacter protophormiae TaxID=37930 RepID=UPI003A943CD6